ncbi:MAG: dihydrolipoamide dehydrogenase [Rhodospirillaceae bacterium TMED8]|nr:dihydrolipoamide dehydrogenase [Magnetovibrio sp.]OUT51189.1 MAG: dihydrolipoamide dehydrogenase [Rhodospirillaceae bacterium TMED8]|tara:strand:- start:301 stop:1734 length:1434 start_codon:yes stop_codon:yes gene_type:complete
MTQQIKKLNVDVCVIGAGPGGLSVAAGASQLGADTVLIEKNKMGGDCLNGGCVPSKALLAAGHAAQAVRLAKRFGIKASFDKVKSAEVFAHVRRTVAAIEPMDSVERFEGLGVRVLQAEGYFVGPRQVQADGVRICARRYVIATGARAFIPSLPGIETIDYLTNETVFQQNTLPDKLIVIGGGPAGVELAQAHRHLGCQVELLEKNTIISDHDPELVDIVRRSLINDGIKIHENLQIEQIFKTDKTINVIAKKDNLPISILGNSLLVAVGRRPNVEGIGLSQAGIKYSERGINVDARLRTSNKKVFAIGDVAGSYQLSHIAGYHAGVVIKNILFHIPAQVDYRAVPSVIFSSPELAQVGMSEVGAKQSGQKINVLRWPFSENDRAQAEGVSDGLVKVIVKPNGRILGAAIVGPHAGELIHTWVLAISQRLKVGAVAQMIAPYPTLGEVSKRAAGSFFSPLLFSERTRKIVRLLGRFG